MRIPRPSLSAYILTWNSSTRLPSVLDNLASFADEIVVGVDSESDEETLKIALSYADIVFQFEHTGIPEHARMFPLEMASGDWLLAMDDDECMETNFKELLPELLGDERYTHYHFPTKWIASLDPVTYFCGPPWFPDWHIRLFRRDPRLVFYPPRVHQGVRVLGLGAYEHRTALLHFERFARTPEERKAKLARYRAHGSQSQTDDYYLVENAPRRLLESVPSPWGAAQLPTKASGPPAELVPGLMAAVDRSEHPPYKAIVTVNMPLRVAAGQSLIVEGSALNTGGWFWYPPTAAPTLVALSYHVYGKGGDLETWDGARTPVSRITAPGETARFLASFLAPDRPGTYEVEWDMLSELECWFSEAEGTTYRSTVHVY